MDPLPVYRLAIRITSPSSSPSTNVWHFRTGNWGDSIIDAAAAAGAISRLRSLYANVASYWPTGWSATSDGPVNAVTKEAGPGSWTTVAGTGVGGTLPPHLAVVASWKTTSRTRRGTGRTFFGPLVPGWMQSDGTITDAVLTNFRTEVNSFVTDSKVDNGWAFGVWGQQDAMPKATSEARLAAPHLFRDVLTGTVKDQFAVMRSRRP